MAKPKNKTTKSKFDATKLFVGALTIPAAELDLFKQWVNIVEQIQRNTPIDQIPCPSHPYILQGLMVSNAPNLYEAKVNWLTLDGNQAFLVKHLLLDNFRHLTTTTLWSSLCKPTTLTAFPKEVRDYFCPVLDRARQISGEFDTTRNLLHKATSSFHYEDKSQPTRATLEDKLTTLQNELLACLTYDWSSSGYEKRTVSTKVRKI